MEEFGKHWILALLLSAILPAIANSDLDNCSADLINGLSNKIQLLEDKITRIHDMLQINGVSRLPNAWKGNQSTFGSFKRLKPEAKEKIISFELENMENLELTTLMAELSPCTNLESIKLSQVELLGRFPNSSDKLLLPNFHDFELNLSNYPNFRGDPINQLLFIKKAEGMEVTLENVTELRTNIHLSFHGLTQFVLNHDFHEMVLNSGSGDLASEIVAGISPSIFKLKQLTVYMGQLNTSFVPLDLSYLNLKYVYPDSADRPTTEYNDFVKKLRRLRALHIDNNYDPAFGACIDLSTLPYKFQALSLRHMRVNMTDPPLLLSKLETVLWNDCWIDKRIIDGIHHMFPDLKKIAVFFHFSGDNDLQCYPLLNRLIYFRDTIYLRNLEYIYIGSCPRDIRPDYRPSNYEKVDKFLTGLGLGNSRSFLLERKKGTNDWTGRNVTREDDQLAKYQLSDWQKLRTWEAHSEI